MGYGSYGFPRDWQVRFWRPILWQWRDKNTQMWRNKNVHPTTWAHRNSSRQRVREHPLFPTFLEPVAIALNIQSRAVVEDPVQNCGSNNMVTEYLAPFAVRFVRGKYRRRRLLSPWDQVEETMCTFTVEQQVSVWIQVNRSHAQWGRVSLFHMGLILVFSLAFVYRGKNRSFCKREWFDGFVVEWPGDILQFPEPILAASNDLCFLWYLG